MSIFDPYHVQVIEVTRVRADGAQGLASFRSSYSLTYATGGSVINDAMMAAAAASSAGAASGAARSVENTDINIRPLTRVKVHFDSLSSKWDEVYDSDSHKVSTTYGLWISSHINRFRQ